MNTKILFAIAGAVALSACSNNKEPESTVSAWEFPLVEPDRPNPRPRSSRPPAPTVVSPNGFRVPDVTEKLPNLHNRPGPGTSPNLAPTPGNPLSVGPTTPPPTVAPSPPLAPTPGIQATPAPDVTPAPPSE